MNQIRILKDLLWLDKSNQTKPNQTKANQTKLKQTKQFII